MHGCNDPQFMQTIIFTEQGGRPIKIRACSKFRPFAIVLPFALMSRPWTFRLFTLIITLISAQPVTSSEKSSLITLSTSSLSLSLTSPIFFLHRTYLTCIIFFHRLGFRVVLGSQQNKLCSFCTDLPYNPCPHTCVAPVLSTFALLLSMNLHWHIIIIQSPQSAL